MTWVMLPRGWPGRLGAWLGCIAIVLHRVDGPPERCFDAAVLDVAQGLSVLVRTRDRALLYDTGVAFPGGASMAQRVILPYLAGQGIEHIDRLVISHSDLDHAGGVADLRAGVGVGDVLAGEPSVADAALPCRRGESWRWNGVGFRFLHPPVGEHFDGNDASCVLQVEAGGSRLLLTGDIEDRSEQALLAERDALRADVALVPHHGSSTSSTRAFVAAVGADYALVSAGYRNRWGLPKPEVVERWRERGAEVLSTVASGAISLRVCADSGISALHRNREATRRVWHE
jgi:competence protein ComEC